MTKKKTCSFFNPSGILWLLPFGMLFFIFSGFAFGANSVNAKASMDQSMRSGKFLSLIFYEKKDPAYNAMSTCIDNFAKSSKGKLIVIRVG